ncbi:ATPase [Sphingomonas sp. AP4-R1]|nr:ATPase [Sphingomonas sp. AP4-R1]
MMTSRTHAASRTLIAPPRAIFRAFLDPEVIPKWRVPAQMDARILSFEGRIGGGYRMELIYRYPAKADPKSTGDSDIVEARFVELVPDEKIVEELVFEGADPRFMGKMTLTTTLKAVANGTKVSFQAEQVPSGISEADHVAGMEFALKNLAFLLE